MKRRTEGPKHVERERDGPSVDQIALQVTEGLPPYPIILGFGTLALVEAGCEIRRYGGVVFALDRERKLLVAAAPDTHSARQGARAWRKHLDEGREATYQPERQTPIGA